MVRGIACDLKYMQVWTLHHSALSFTVPVRVVVIFGQAVGET
jgi:hypothetical protein